MRQVEYTDERGRKYLVRLPDGVPDEDASKGIPIGPPDIVDELELPEPLATRLHNLLFRNKLWSATEVRKQPELLASALRSALRVDVQELMQAYIDLERS